MSTQSWLQELGLRLRTHIWRTRRQNRVLQDHFILLSTFECVLSTFENNICWDWSLTFLDLQFQKHHHRHCCQINLFKRTQILHGGVKPRTSRDVFVGWGKSGVCWLFVSVLVCFCLCWCVVGRINFGWKMLETQSETCRLQKTAANKWWKKFSAKSWIQIEREKEVIRWNLSILGSL